ncbi:MAG TPA: hypothetical protein VFC84_04740 [Desulfosporosinus sp.]|nr:hypothetical protein [Desulfosporosinus sp.]
MEKKTFEFTKSVCERYDIHFEHGGWAIFTIDENGGLFNCHSDYGDYNYSWPNHGCKLFKHFILDLARDTNYFLGKVAKRDYFDSNKAVEQWKSRIIEIREDGECTKEQARDAWTFITTGIDVTLSIGYLQTMIYGSKAISAISEEPWYDFEMDKDYSPQATFFAHEIMPMLAEILKKEIELVNQELDTSLIGKGGDGFTPVNLQKFKYAQIKDLLKNGQKIIARIGRAGRTCVNWKSPEEYTLFVQRNKSGEIVILGIKEAVWAEYSPNDYEGDNIFLTEDYYMEVLDWRMERDKQ